MHLTKLHLHNLDVHCLLFIHNKNVRLKLSACPERTKARLKKRKERVLRLPWDFQDKVHSTVLFMEMRKFSHGQRQAWKHRQRRAHFQRLRLICKPSVACNNMSSVSNFPGSFVSSQSNVNALHGPSGTLRKDVQESRNHSAAQTWN